MKFKVEKLELFKAAQFLLHAAADGRIRKEFDSMPDKIELEGELVKDIRCDCKDQMTHYCNLVLRKKPKNIEEIENCEHSDRGMTCDISCEQNLKINELIKAHNENPNSLPKG